MHFSALCKWWSGLLFTPGSMVFQGKIVLQTSGELSDSSLVAFICSFFQCMVFMCFELRKADEKDYLFSHLDAQVPGQLLLSLCLDSQLWLSQISVIWDNVLSSFAAFVYKN